MLLSNKLASVFLFFSVISYSIVPAVGQGGVVAAGVIAKVALDDVENRVNATIANVGVAAGYAAEKAARAIFLELDALRRALGSDVDRQLDNLSAQTKDAISSIRSETERLEKMKDDILRLEDFLALDTSSFFNRFPFLGNVFTLRRIDGYGQYYREQGSYDFAITGNAFQFGSNIQISIDGQQLTPNSINVKSANVVTFSIPAESVNGRFSETEVRRVPFEVVVYGAPPSWWQFWRSSAEVVFRAPFTILLLPKYPATYKAEELDAAGREPDKSRTTWAKGAIETAPASGRTTGWPEPDCGAPETRCINVCADIPDGIPTGKVTTYEAWEGYGKFMGPLPNSASRVCWQYKHWSHNRSRNVSIDAEYWPYKPVVNSSEILARPIGGSAEALAAASKGRLMFGQAYELVFAGQYQSFNLILKTFNGELGVITPVTPHRRVDGRMDASSTLKRFVMTLRQIE